MPSVLCEILDFDYEYAAVKQERMAIKRPNSCKIVVWQSWKSSEEWSRIEEASTYSQGTRFL